MSIDEGIKLFEENKTAYIAGSAALLGNGVLICPLTKETHEHLIGWYYFVDQDHEIKLVSVKQHVLYSLKWVMLYRPVNQELLYCVADAEDHAKSMEEIESWIRKNAAPHILRYLESETGQVELRLYLNK